MIDVAKVLYYLELVQQSPHLVHQMGAFVS